MNSRYSYPRMIDWILAVTLLISACTPTPVAPAAKVLPTATLQPVLPTATLPLPTPTIGIPGGHTTTTWSVEANLAYDALCFIPTLTGDPFFLKFYQSEYNRFSPKLTPAVKQTLEEIRTVAKEHDSLLSSTLVSLFLPLAPKNLDDLLKALENPDVIRRGAGLTEDDQSWQLILSHIPNLHIIVRWLQEAGFEKDYADNIYPQVLKKAEELNEKLPQYNIIPVIEASLGEVLPTNHFTMYLAHYPLPFGLGLGANVSLFSSDLPLSGIVDNSIHENLHLLDIQEKELWEALSFLQQDAYYMNNFKIHDPNGGYMVYEEFLEEDVVEALDQFLAEKFDVAENPRTRWGSQPTGTHTLSPVLYTLLKLENYSPEKETYHDFLIRMIREGKLKAGTIEEANHQFYANKTEAAPLVESTPSPADDSPSTTTQPVTPAVDLVSRAKDLVNQLAGGNFENATLNFDENMKKAAPATMLKTTWEQLINQVGPFQQQISALETQNQGYQVVTITCQFEKDVLNAIVTFDVRGQVAGLNFQQAQPSEATSQDNTAGASMDGSSVQGVKDPAELETFLDGLFTKQMTDYGIAGLTFSLVKDGQVFFQKGYGYADLEKRTPVDPAATIFRTGSVTKLFTWTAVMQLVEQGKLDLNADVNTYLDFKIPDTFPEPITLKHLLSHTAGFEDLALGTKVTTYDQIQPLGKFLASHLPARVRPAGQAAVYSNYGADLAGYIVERVSGMPYADYLETHIFKTLGMENTTARLPLPAELAPKLSTGYATTQGTVQLGTFKIPNTQPDCCVSSTAADMARFMIAHLNGGQLPGGKGQILEAATAKQMQTSLWTPDERLKGFAYGFMEVILNGQRILYHGGDINPFHSLLVLFPDQNLGFFVAYNTDTAVSLWASDVLGFVENYFPQAQVAPQPPEGFDARANHFTGYYRPMRGAYTTLEKVNVLKTWAAVKPSHDGALLWQPAFSPLSIRIIESAPLLFVEPQSGLPSVFTEDHHQNITYVFDALPAGMPYEKLPWHANPYLHYGLLGACALLFLSVVLAVPTGFVLRFFKKGKPIPQPLARAARWLAFLVAALNLVGLGVFLMLFLGSGDAIFYGQMSTIYIMLVAWFIAAIFTVPVLVLAVLSWKNRYWGVASRIHYSLMVVAALAFTWFLNYWNLLGFRF